MVYINLHLSLVNIIWCRCNTSLGGATMATELPKYLDVKTGTIYYLDCKLGEFRNVDNPHDRLPSLTHRQMRRLGKRKKG